MLVRAKTGHNLGCGTITEEIKAVCMHWQAEVFQSPRIVDPGILAH